MRTLIKYGLLIVCIINAILLSFSRVIPTINPFEQSMVGILGFLVPIFAIINFIFLVFWLVTRKYFYVIIPVLAFILSWRIVSVNMAASLPRNYTGNKDSLFSVMSYNVRLLDLYKWSGVEDTRSRMLTYLRKKSSDVICLQEFYSGNDSMGINNIKAIQDSCLYPFVAECIINQNKRGKWGSVIFSKYPIIQAHNHDIDVKGSNLLQEVSVKINHDTISIYNIHLQSNKFSTSESALVEKKEIPSWDSNTQTSTKSIYNKLANSAINRGLEAILVGKIIHENHNRSVICGDLNDIPSSFVYFTIRGNKQDAFLDNGLGIGATYNKTIPLLRIDYIFYDPRLQLAQFEKDAIIYSDHYPLISYYKL